VVPSPAGRPLRHCLHLEAGRSPGQISAGIATPVGHPALSAMVRRVVDDMAALTKALEVAQPVVSRIVVQMRGSQHDACATSRDQRQQIRLRKSRLRLIAARSSKDLDCRSALRVIARRKCASASLSRIAPRSNSPSSRFFPWPPAARR
jgi:hypothetical protein